MARTAKKAERGPRWAFHRAPYAADQDSRTTRCWPACSAHSSHHSRTCRICFARVLGRVARAHGDPWGPLAVRRQQLNGGRGVLSEVVDAVVDEAADVTDSATHRDRGDLS